MEQADKVREIKLRRTAFRRGFQLQRSRARDPGSLTFGGYQIIDPQYNTMVFGKAAAGHGFGATLEEVEDFLKSGVNSDKVAKLGRPFAKGKRRVDRQSRATKEARQS